MTRQTLWFSRMLFVVVVVLVAASVAVVQAQALIDYQPLSAWAHESGQAERYKDVAVREGVAEAGGYRLWVKAPQQARAYDVIPLEILAQRPAYDGGYVAVEAVAYEDPDRAAGRPLYDLTIPGNLEVKIEYLGSVSADYQQDSYIPLTPDPQTPVSPFPPFQRDEMVKSGTVRAADLVWFKFRVTNTGDTILDPEGFSGCLAEPFLVRLDAEGKEQWRAQPVNLFTRHLTYVYPGESYEQWVNFHAAPLGPQRLGLTPGRYRIDYRMVARFYDKYDWMRNIWSGTEFARLETSLLVTSEGGQTPVDATMVMPEPCDRMPGYFAAFEEFMTSFKMYPYRIDAAQIQDKLYLQVAPWTREVVVKLIHNDPRQIVTVRLPIEISQETLAIEYNPDNPMVLSDENGVEQPVFISQSMPAMRSGFQLGPYPERHMRRFLQEQKDLGVNVIVNTAGDWWIPEISGRREVEMHSACYKYFYDVLMRELGMKVMGWSLYPPTAPHWYAHAENLLGEKLDLVTTESGYTSGDAMVKTVDVLDPAVPRVIAAWVIYQYKRWGDMWYRTKDGRAPIDIEDTWGWMRDDINIRYGVGALGLDRFRQELQQRYETIAQLNAAWNSDYKSFAQIDPQKDQHMFHSGFEFDNPQHAFHDWSPATEEWDRFRTKLRLEVYRATNEILRQVIPGAELALRTEGANLIVAGKPDGSNMHWRHVYYSQRRNAMVFDVIRDMDVLHFHSDYTTLPYTPTEWRRAMRDMVAAGGVPAYLPQFDHMRDILLNPWYGREYQMHYDLDKPSKGIMVHCLMAAYPWWKATYEEGGAPGMIWSDYLCDGFATETQKRELKLLRQYWNRMTRE